MAAIVMTVETGLQIVAQLLPLIQQAYSAGQPIDVAAWNAALGNRNADLAKLDADIAAADAGK